MRVRRVVQYSGTERGGILKVSKAQKKRVDKTLGKSLTPQVKKRFKNGKPVVAAEEFACPLCPVNLPESRLVRHIRKVHL